MGYRIVARFRTKCQDQFDGLDDFVFEEFPATESGTPHLPVVGIVGIEIYRSAGETPPQFLKGNSQCGVIVIWTKSGP